MPSKVLMTLVAGFWAVFGEGLDGNYSKIQLGRGEKENDIWYARWCPV